MYLSELPPRKYKGASGVLNQLSVTIGIVISNIMGLSAVLGGTNTWPVLVGLTFVPMVICLVGFPFCVESPKFVYSTQNNPRGAEASMMKE